MPPGSPDGVPANTEELSLLRQLEALSIETGLQRGEALMPGVCSSFDVEAAPFELHMCGKVVSTTMGRGMNVRNGLLVATVKVYNMD